MGRSIAALVVTALVGAGLGAASTRAVAAAPVAVSRPGVAASDGTPVGHLDSVQVSPGLIRLRGWAGEDDGPLVTRVDVAYDGNFVSHANASWRRPDVQAATGLPLTTGFSLVLPIVPGPHSVCVYARNSDSRGFPFKTLGCRDVSVPGAGPRRAHDPRGSLDVLRSFFDQTTGMHFRPVGWAFDPDASGPLTVRVRYLSREQIFNTNVDAMRDVTTGIARPDVAVAIAGAGPSTGFATAFPVSQFLGVEVLCAYARNVGPGRDRLLGCRTAVDV